MEAIMFMSVCLLLYSFHIEGSSAVTRVFVLKGKDVQLNVTNADELKDFFLLSWNYNKTENVVTFFPDKKPNSSPAYKGSIEFPEEKFSVKLKNLQDADSRVYSAKVINSGGEKSLDEYHVTVRDPVSAAQLSVDSVSNSSDSCNLTVTCRARDAHISTTFTCDTRTCSQEGGRRSEVTTFGASLSVYLVNDSVICYHSNEVSSTENTTDIRRACQQHKNIKHGIPIWVPVLIVILVLFIILMVLTVLFIRKKKSKSETINNTIYETPQVATEGQPLATINASSDSSPNTIYTTVTAHSAPISSPKTTDRSLPESLYAQVERSAKS